MSSGRFISWHYVGPRFESIIKSIIDYGALLPASMNTSNKRGVEVVDYLVGDAEFVYMHVTDINEKLDEFNRGVMAKSFYFDAVELIRSGAILRTGDLYAYYTYIVRDSVNSLLGKNYSLSEAKQFVRYAVASVEELFFEPTPDSWFFKHEAEIEKEVQHVLDNGILDSMFKLIRERGVEVRNQNEYLGEDAISMMAGLGSRLQFVELIWEGPLPLYLALNDSPAFRTAE